jgi:pentatricopeptide repeat protein
LAQTLKLLSLQLLKLESLFPSYEAYFHVSIIKLFIVVTNPWLLWRCGDGDQAIKLYERMQKANLAMKLEGGKDPIERMLLDVMDAALVGALASVRLSFYGSLH